jgi:hypothetical protein
MLYIDCTDARRVVQHRDGQPTSRTMGLCLAAQVHVVLEITWRGLNDCPNPRVFRRDRPTVMC